MDSKTIIGLPKYWQMIMKSYGISAREVSIKAEVNLPHFYHVLKGDSSPTLDYVAKIDTVVNDIVNERQEIVKQLSGMHTSSDGEDNADSRDTQQRANV